MNKILLSIILLLHTSSTCMVQASSYVTSQAKAMHSQDDDVPETKVICGDLNKDGFEDKVVIQTPRNKEHIIVREDGYEYNFNQPILYIYFQDENSQFKLYKKYDNVLPHPEDETECLDLDVSITDRGVLKIFYSLFYSMGSYEISTSTHLYRYQNDDFYLIGTEFYESSRNIGDYTNISINYSTHKKQITKGNNFNDKKPKVTWYNLPITPLYKLGDINLKD